MSSLQAIVWNGQVITRIVGQYTGCAHMRFDPITLKVCHGVSRGRRLFGHMTLDLLPISKVKVTA